MLLRIKKKNKNFSKSENKNKQMEHQRHSIFKRMNKKFKNKSI